MIVRDKSKLKPPNPHTELLLLLRDKEREKRGREAYDTGIELHKWKTGRNGRMG
jgi:hypothetical protein